MTRSLLTTSDEKRHKRHTAEIINN